MAWKGSYTVRGIPDKLWEDFRILAVKKRKTIKEYLLDLVESEIKRNKKKKDEEEDLPVEMICPA